MLERILVTVPEDAVEAYKAALSSTCETVGFFGDDTTGIWQVEGIRRIGNDGAELAAALALAEAVGGPPISISRERLAPTDWLKRSYAGFPEQRIGRRFAIRGSHVDEPRAPGRITLCLDAGMAFGSGEHGSTRGCLRALERVAYRRPCRILDLGTGSGVLAMAAASLLHRPVLGIDLDPWAVRAARQNARANRLGHLVRIRLANGWRNPAVRATAPYDLVLANVLARPLALMARDLAARLRPGGTVVLSGLLRRQANDVLTAHRRKGLRLERRIDEGAWSALVLRR